MTTSTSTIAQVIAMQTAENFVNDFEVKKDENHPFHKVTIEGQEVVLPLLGEVDEQGNIALYPLPRGAYGKFLAKNEEGVVVPSEPSKIWASLLWDVLTMLDTQAIQERKELSQAILQGETPKGFYLDKRNGSHRIIVRETLTEEQKAKNAEKRAQEREALKALKSSGMSIEELMAKAGITL